jgi:site-specific recombinase XerD
MTTKTHQLEQLEKTLPYTKDARYCPVRNVQAWLKILGNPSKGWLFISISKMDTIKKDKNAHISDRSVSYILKKDTEAAGIKESFSGHSPRRGAATDIYNQKKDSLAVKNAGGWRSNVYETYIDENEEEKFRNSGVNGLI